MSQDVSVNFGFLAAEDPLLHEIARSAETLLHLDPNATLVKVRQLAEQMTRNAAAHLGITPDPQDKFIDLIGSIRRRGAIDAKVCQLLHGLRKSGNEAVHKYKQDAKEAGKALREARQLCVWYHRTFHRSDSFSPGPFKEIRNWKADEEAQRNEVERLKNELEESKARSEHNEELVRRLAAQEIRLRAMVTEREADTEAASQLLEELEGKLEELKRDQEAALTELSVRRADGLISTADIAERSKRASQDLETGWAPEITLKDAFEDYELTANQAELVQELEAFLLSDNESVFLLAGYAGTGKTFITKGLSSFLWATGRAHKMAAPTGKAARVITQRTGQEAETIHGLIYSMKDIKEYKVEELDGSETFKLYAELKANTDPDNTVYMVDEASMVSDFYSEGEFFRFGSGRLLTDLMKYVNLDHNDHSKKVIFIGDAAQLPPVKMKTSPALDRKYLAQEFGLRNIRHYELTEVVRQKAQSGILVAANTLRESIARRSFNQMSLAISATDVVTRSGADDLVSAYLETSDHKVNDTAMIIASSNADVASYNKVIRSRLFPGQDRVAKRDKLVVVMNRVVNDIPLKNGDLVYVTQADESFELRPVTLRRKNEITGKVEQIEVDLRFKDIEIGFREPGGTVVKIKTKILENLLYSSQPALSSDESKALYVDFKKRNPHLAKNPQARKQALGEDPYFQALHVKFGYALTCHKAQGSEWRDVFVDCQTHHNQRTEDYFRWLYTAITRASDRLHLLHAPNFSPWDSPRPVVRPTRPDNESTSIPVPREAGSTSPADSCGDNGNIDIQPASIAADVTGNPILDGIRRTVIAALNELQDVKIDSIAHNDWQEAYFISRGDDATRINISYNGKGKVGSVQPVPRDEFGMFVASHLSGLTGQQFISLPPHAATPNQFERDVFNSFYPVFQEKASANDIKILRVTEEPWNLRLSLSNSAGSGEVAIFCNARGRITKYDWIGRLPHPGLREALDLVMGDL